LSRFGGNAYGFGFFEAYDRLSPRDQRFLQSITPDKPEYARRSYKEINRIYENMGLLIRFSGLGKPYYLIPVHYVSRSLSTIRNKADEITSVIQAHRKKTLKESLRIGFLTHSDDLLIPELSLRFKEHQVIILDSFEKFSSLQIPLDLVILPRELHELVFTERFSPQTGGVVSKRRLESYAYYTRGRFTVCSNPMEDLHRRKPFSAEAIVRSRSGFIPKKKRKISFFSATSSRRRNNIRPRRSLSP
jgi:hypothetical protein